MKRDEVIKMAREAGISFKMMVIEGAECDYRLVNFNDDIGGDEAGCIERFAALVAAAEREECAKVCENLYANLNDDADCSGRWSKQLDRNRTYASAIRARSQS